MSIKKISKESIVLSKIPDGIWSGSNIAEILPATGDTKMSCGIHEILASETVVEKAPVDDVLYILEGEIEIDSDTRREPDHSAHCNKRTKEKLKSQG